MEKKPIFNREEIELSKKDYDIGSTMGMIMKLILELE